MKRILFGSLVLVLALPLGLRIWSWDRGRTTQLDAAEVAAGKVLFDHVWTANDPLAHGDGLGPVFNARSCLECHFQGGNGGGGDLKHNVTMFIRSGRSTPGGVLHAHGISPRFTETFASVDSGLPALSQASLAQLKSPPFIGRADVIFSQRNTPALFGSRQIDELPDRAILANMRKQTLLAPTSAGRALVLADGRVGRFGWRSQTATLLDFVQGACANELGLSNPGHAQPVSLAAPDQKGGGEDLTLDQCKQMAVFLASLPRPEQRIPDGQEDDVHQGEKLFNRIGCAVCHTPDVGSVPGIYSDLLLHKMGDDLSAGGFYYGDVVALANAPSADEWRTPPLWGCADSGPYMHDGRAGTLDEAIRAHGNQAEEASRRYQALPGDEQERVVAFLKSLRAPQ